MQDLIMNVSERSVNSKARHTGSNRRELLLESLKVHQGDRESRHLHVALHYEAPDKLAQLWEVGDVILVRFGRLPPVDRFASSVRVFGFFGRSAGRGEHGGVCIGSTDPDDCRGLVGDVVWVLSARDVRGMRFDIQKNSGRTLFLSEWTMV